MTSRARTTGFTLAAWSLGFAAFHAAWALGWRGGVPDGVPPILERPVFLAYDVVAGLLMVVAAVVAVLLGRRGLDPSTRDRLRRATLVGAVAALLRGAPALAVDVATLDVRGLGPLADAWFVVAGILGLALHRSTRPTAPTRPDERLPEVAAGHRIPDGRDTDDRRPSTGRASWAVRSASPTRAWTSTPRCAVTSLPTSGPSTSS